MVKTSDARKQRSILYRPERPTREDGAIRGPKAPDDTRFCCVFQMEDCVAAYDVAYYPTLADIKEDLMRLIESGELKGVWGEGDDYAVWWNGELVAYVTRTGGTSEFVMVKLAQLFTSGDPAQFLPGFPSYREWVANGKGPLWFNG